MLDPLPGAQAIIDAYALAQGSDRSSVDPCQDVIWGRDLDGARRIYGIVRQNRISYRGTLIPQVHGILDLVEWLEDALAILVPTPYGGMAEGTWRLFQSLETESGRPITAYSAGTDGHSLGALLACPTAALNRCPMWSWACPKGVDSTFLENLLVLESHFPRELGDIVWRLGFGQEPTDGVIDLNPQGTGDLAWHHSMSTYIASYRSVMGR